MFHNWYRTWLMSRSLGRRGTKRASGSSRWPGSRVGPWRLRSWLRIEALESRYAPSCTIGIQFGVLTVNCDNSGNFVNVDHNAVTHITTINGLNFADAAFTSIKINGGFGHDTDNLLATPPVVVNVNNNGPSTVNVGKPGPFGGSVQGILSLVSIENPPNLNTITVDDSADPVPHNTELNTVVHFFFEAFGAISNLAPGEIQYEYQDTSSVTIKTGSAIQTVNVLATGVPTTLVGNANETVNVGNGSVQNIGGALTVTNPPSFTTLTVNNSADTTRHLVTMGTSGINGFIDGLAPAAINYHVADVRAVTVDGGPNSGQGGFNTYTVTNTVNNGTNPLTTLNVGNALSATVNVHATSGPLTVTSTRSNATWTVGLAGSMQGIHGAVTLNNAQNTPVVLDDSADVLFQSFTINDTSVVGLAPAVINYEGQTGLSIHTSRGISSVMINGNSGSGSAGTSLFLGSPLTPQVAVRGTTGPLNIFPGSGTTAGAEIIVGTLAPFEGTGDTLANIHGQLFDGNFGTFGSLTLDDESDTTARTVTVGGASGGDITGLAPADIRFVPNRRSLVFIHGGQAGNTFTVTASPPGGLDFAAGTGGDTVNVQRTEGPLSIEANGGVDTVNLGNTSDGTASIQGAVFIGHQAGHTTVNVNDAANPFAATDVTLSVAGTPPLGTVSGLGDPFSPFTLQYVPIEVSSLTFNGGSHGNVYNVQSVPSGVATTLHTGSGNDLINVGNAANTLDGILGPLTVDGQAGFDTLNINDQGEFLPHSYTVNATTVVRSPGGPTITYLDIESLNLHPGRLLPPGPGPTNNVVDVLGTDANTAVEVDAGDGTIVNVGNEDGTLDDLQGPLNVYGEDGSVILNVDDQGSAGSQNYSVAADAVDRTGAATISYLGVADLTLNAGVGGNQIDVQSLAFGTPATVNAGPAADLIRMRGGPINAPLTLRGQGNTRLGYVAYTTPVFVDTQTGQATDLKGGFSGISDITGGQDLNILVGGGTENLNGVPGSHNLLISGGGSGLTLTGGGGAGDILIDGTTAYDADANGELEAIMAEWTRTDIPYSQIVDNIRSGSDTAIDPYPLDVGTVFDNGAQNNLVGHPSGGSGQEMNLYYVTNNTSDDATPSETVINVSGPSTAMGGMPNHPGNQAVADEAPTGVANPVTVPASNAQHTLASTLAVPASHPAIGLGQPLAQDLAWLGGASALALNGLGVG